MVFPDQLPRVLSQTPPRSNLERTHVMKLGVTIFPTDYTISPAKLAVAAEENLLQ